MGNKTILITGANRGIGRALVNEALQRGAIFRGRDRFASGARTGRIECPAIVGFYEQLNRIGPTVGRLTGYAA